MIHLLIQALDILPIFPLLDAPGIDELESEPLEGMEEPRHIPLDLLQVARLEVLQDELVVPHQEITPLVYHRDVVQLLMGVPGPDGRRRRLHDCRIPELRIEVSGGEGGGNREPDARSQAWLAGTAQEPVILRSEPP